MENMILMGDIKIPKEAISRQIAESVDLDRPGQAPARRFAPARPTSPR
jgi:hypothetical protein